MAVVGVFICRFFLFSKIKQEDRRAAQKAAAERFADWLEDEHLSLGLTFRSVWRDVRDAIERKAPADTDVLEETDRRKLVDEMVKKLVKVCGLGQSPFRALSIWRGVEEICVFLLLVLTDTFYF